MTANPAKYTKIDANALPTAGFFWITPNRCGGQIIEVSYGGPRQRANYDVGAPYKRIIDHSKPVGSPDRATYYKRA